jgi:hypothetical protein
VAAVAARLNNSVYGREGATGRSPLLRSQPGPRRSRPLDFVANELVVRTSRGDVEDFPLADGFSVAAFHERL